MSSLGRFTDFVHDGAREAALGEDEMGRLDLILEEILVNVFNYAYAEAESGTATVEYRVEGPAALLVRVRDGGTAYNPLDRPDPDLTLDIESRPIGGLGVYLVRTLANSVEYRREDGENVLSFRVKS
jgi:anti-sigma regulatory factor (Ser/Thr protein kinase)